jgi:hypothetical protein
MTTKRHPARPDKEGTYTLSVTFSPEAMAHLVRLQELYQESAPGHGQVTRGETIRRALRHALLSELERRANPHADSDGPTREWLEVASGFNLGGEPVTPSEGAVLSQLLDQLYERKPEPPKKGRKK